LSTIWLLAGLTDARWALTALAWPVIVVGTLATIYTAFLFAQGRARDLWQGHTTWVDLIAQAGTAGCAVLMLATTALGKPVPGPVVMLLAGSLFLHVSILLFENVVATSPTAHHQLAVATIRRGPFSRLFWGLAIGGGGVLPLAMLIASNRSPKEWFVPIAAVLALAGSAAWEYVWVEAGQSVPIS
jgi:Ni/Fe-hydrogenase subunit HybB-like protein